MVQPTVIFTNLLIMRLGSNLNYSVHLLRMILKLQNFYTWNIIGKNSIMHRLNAMVNNAFMFLV